MRIATQGQAAYCPGQPVPCAYFRVLQGEADAVRGETDAARRALELELPASLARSRFAARRLFTLAILQDRAGRLELRTQSLDAAERLAREVAPEIAVEIKSFRAVTTGVDEPRRALQVFQEVLQAVRQRRDRFLEAQALGNIGWALMHLDRYKEALDVLEESRRVFHRVAGQENFKTIGNIGNCYHELGNFESALDYYQRALKGLTEQLFVKDQVTWLLNTAEIEREFGDPVSAKQRMLHALKLAQQAVLPAQQAATYADLAVTSLQLRDERAAAEYNQSALRLFHELEQEENYQQALIVTAQLAEKNKPGEADALYGAIAEKAKDSIRIRWRAQAQRAMLYAKQRLDQQAEQQFLEALKTAEAMRSAVGSDEHQLSFDNLLAAFFGAYIRFFTDRGRDQEALGIAEHARAQTLEEALGLRGPARASDPRDAARAFGGAILSYWLDKAGSHLWVITEQGVRRVNLPPEEQIDALITAYRGELQGTSDPRQSSAGAKLYDLLVAPAGVAAGTRVAILPSRRLYELNFETLVAKAPKPHFWIEDVTITTSSSLALLAAGSRRAVPQGDDLLLVGNVPSPDPQRFSSLPNAKDEVQRISAQFPKHQVLSGKSATPAAYLRKNPQAFTFIHFVAHGDSAALRPLDSSIILARDDPRSYRLLARDIIGQPRLHARLVTISSCYGAGVRAYAGEGLVGLAWAFLRAGSHQVVAALWEANDSATPELMETMYSEIRKGRDPASALRQAKLQLLRSDSINRHPKYWAPFVLYSGA